MNKDLRCEYFCYELKDTNCRTDIIATRNFLANYSLSNIMKFSFLSCFLFNQKYFGLPCSHRLVPMTSSLKKNSIMKIYFRHNHFIFFLTIYYFIILILFRFRISLFKNIQHWHGRK